MAKQDKCFDGDDLFFSKHKPVLDAPFNTVYSFDEREVSWFAEKQDVLLEHTD